MDLKYEISEAQWKGPVTILSLEGQLDRAFQPDLDDSVQSTISGGARFWAVNLAGLESLSSAGISSLVNLKGSLDRVTGNLCFFGASPRIDKVITAMGLKRLAEFYETEDAAKTVFPAL